MIIVQVFKNKSFYARNFKFSNHECTCTVLKNLHSTSTQVPIHKLSKSIDLFSHKYSTYT